MFDYVVFFGVILFGVVFAYLSIKSEKNNEEISEYDYELSKCESPIEIRLFKSLWNCGIETHTQYVEHPYRLDMVIFNPKICIECDGREWHSTATQKAHDRRRTAYLRRKGWKVIRFSGRQINRDVKRCVRRVRDEIEKLRS